MSIWFKRILILFFVSFLINDFAFAQQDTIKADTTRLYKDIESISKRTKFGTFFYRMFFKPVAAVPKKAVPRKGYKKLIQKPYSTFEGKIIRNINIVTLDPFGYSVTDTTFTKKNFFFKAGNLVHIKTQISTILDLLLIKKNEKFNSLQVKESERLIRSQNYVHEVFFYVVSAGIKSDSVDILIRELDKWSIIPQGSFSPSGFRVGITDKNFLGFGHEFENVFTRKDTNGVNSFSTNYSIPNIRNTYISTTLHYGFDGDKNYNRSLSVDRPFYSPLAKWAAGVTLASQSQRDSLEDKNSVYTPLVLKFKTQDYWAGFAQRILKSSTEDDRITNLILAGRYLRVRYFEKPPEFNDPLHIYSDEDFYLAAIGISTRKYVQDKYVFKYGVTEDVPVGKVYELTGGYQVRNDTGRLYLGIRVSFGDYYQWGYLSTNFEYGTFVRASYAEQGVFTAGVNYFTGLIEIGKWKFREFIKPQISIGINRFKYDSLTLNDGYGLDGFNSPSKSGTKRLLLTLQTQSYSPWHLIGFHFGPFLTCSVGMLGNDAEGFKNSKVYSQIGLGVLIKNENLVFNTFQLSISFYPSIPGIGLNVFKMNSFKTGDFGFRDFEIGKPGKALFQ
jgi:hypothetical protein